MIFVTVGTQLSFDRLIKQVDSFAAEFNLPVFAQIGPSEYHPVNMKFTQFCTAKEIDFYIKSSTVVIAHAGMGSIISALVHGKPLVIVPRYFMYSEHRNDHQLATARKFQSKAGVITVFSEDDLKNSIDMALALSDNVGISEFAPDDFVLRLKNIINA